MSCGVSVQMWRTSGVGGATFGHRPKARAQFECNEQSKGFKLRAKTEAPTAKTEAPQAKTKRSEE